MAKERKPIPCPECDREKYFEGLCYWCKNRKKRERYQAMTDEEVARTIAQIIDKIETIDKWEEVYEDFCGLLAYHNINTEEIANAAFAKKIFRPETLYCNASADLRDKMIDMLLQPDCKDAGRLLTCLAVCGGDKELEVFVELENNPLPWREELYVNPSIYAQCGGWSFDEQGNKFDVIYQDCYPIQKSVLSQTDNAVKIGEVKKDICSICGCNIVDILIIDGSDERLAFLELNGKVHIPICPNCVSMCEKTIVRYTLDGESTMEIIEPFSDENYMSQEDLDNLASNKLTLSKTKEPVYYACGVEETCTIGGHADWIQDWQYEVCPDCGKTMKLLSALSWGELDGGEGTLYIEICTGCSVIVTFHQQT